MKRFAGPAVLLALLGIGRLVLPPAKPGQEAGVPAAATDAPLRFLESSRQAGLLNRHKPLPGSPFGAAVSVVDYDGDGWMDVYVVNSAVGSANRLFRNNHDGTFTDVAAAAGLASVNTPAGSKQALFIDADNDGRKDLLLGTFEGVRYFHNDGGVFHERPGPAAFDSYQEIAMASVDLDGDGYPDLIVAYLPRLFDPQSVSSRLMPSPSFFRLHPSFLRVYRNDHGRRFVPFPGDAGLSASLGMPHALALYDLHGSGRPDLFVANDFDVDRLFLNDGRGRFVDASDRLAHFAISAGMSAQIADIDGDGRPLIFVSGIHEPRWMTVGDVVWKESSDGSFSNVAEERGLRRCGWAWASQWGDFDNDGRPDLYVANGQLSADPQHDYWYLRGVVSAAAIPLQMDSRYWPPANNRSMSGYQRDCVFYNTGRGFVDVAEKAGVSERLDGRGAALIDVLNDGRLSVIVANEGQALRFYRNVTSPIGRWIGFSLTGGASGRDAFGARVTVVGDDGRRQTQELWPANGYVSQNDPRLHFGLGGAMRARSVRIRWPSGRVQDLGALAAGRYYAVSEPRR